ncbi:hypothetical protein EJ04DRAFT_173424, partial [Polyplosphaeria fusca]
MWERTMRNLVQLRKRDGDRSPCPSASPPNIGTIQQFFVSCNVDLPGSDSERLPASSLLECVNICANSHLIQGHRCEAVVYEASAAHGTDNCYLKNAVPSLFQQTFVVDSAVPVWPTDNHEDCEGISQELQTSGGFQTHCGQDYPFNDYKQYNADSLASCVGMCAAQNDTCAGVSYEASMESGYLNCYLKNAVGNNGLVTQNFQIDSAFLVQKNEVSSSSTSIQQSSTLTPGLLLHTTTFTTSTSSLTSVTSISSTNASTTPKPSSSKAWIAGAVIGPLVLIAIVGLLCWFFHSRGKRSAVIRVRNGRASRPGNDFPGGPGGPGNSQGLCNL